MKGLRWIVPEVIQTSAMDCGPAALKALLEGFRISVDYDALRAACHTDLDGTSIDTLEALACDLGLDAEQIIVPADHLLQSAAAALPAIVVVRQPSGATHFVVAWRRHGRFVQVMDPATRRRLPTASAFLDECYRHTQVVPAAAWRDWAESEEFQHSLLQRLDGLGLRGSRAQNLLADARTDESWKGLARLDAAVRMMASLAGERAVRRGREASRVLEQLLATSHSESDSDGDSNSSPAIPPLFWSVQPQDNKPGEELLAVTGVVLVRARPGPPNQESSAPDLHLPPRIRRAVGTSSAAPWRTLWSFAATSGRRRLALAAAATVTAAAAVIVEALLFRSLLSVGNWLGAPRLRLGALAAFSLLLLGALLVELGARREALRLGRHLEIRLRESLYRKLPRMMDSYFASRLVSDMAHRAHSLHGLRSIGPLARSLLDTSARMLCITVALLWLAPESAAFVLTTAATVTILPLGFLRVLGEADLRMRSHSGALSRFFLDGMLGLMPVLSHGAEGSLHRRYESLLVEWYRAARQLVTASVAAEAVQAFVGFALACALVFHHLGKASQAGTSLLLIYWALELRVLGRELAGNLHRLPALRSSTLRVAELLRAPEDSDSSVADAGLQAPDQEQELGSETTKSQSGVRIELQEVGVSAAGLSILRDINLSVAAGEHVAVMGPSGVGKSTLMSLLLGWVQPSSGHVLVDGEPLQGDSLRQLRQETAWIDPSVRLWNRSLAANLLYSTQEKDGKDLGPVLRQAELLDVLERLPKGLKTTLGEGGGLLSGGEGQRTRLGRGLFHTEARLVILDEALRGLDHAARQRLLRLCRGCWKSATLLWVTHDVEEALTFPRVVIMNGGQIEEDGPPGALLAAEGSALRRIAESRNPLAPEALVPRGWRLLEMQHGFLREEEQA